MAKGLNSGGCKAKNIQNCMFKHVSTNLMKSTNPKNAAQQPSQVVSPPTPPAFGKPSIPTGIGGGGPWPPAAGQGIQGLAAHRQFQTVAQGANPNALANGIETRRI